jgi:hypothetical protein
MDLKKNINYTPNGGTINTPHSIKKIDNKYNGNAGKVEFSLLDFGLNEQYWTEKKSEKK